MSLYYSTGYRYAPGANLESQALNREGRPAAALPMTEPRYAPLEEAALTPKVEEVEQIVQCRRVQRRIGPRQLYRVWEVVPAAV